MRLLPEHAMAAIAALILAGSAGWLATTSAAPLPSVGRGRADTAPALATVRMPVLGGIEQFDVNDDNPFVPWQQRAAAGSAPRHGNAPAPIPGPSVPIPPAPPLQLPPAQPGGGDAPRVIGFVRGGHIEAGLQVRSPGSAAPTVVRPGSRIGRWTFQAVEAGNIAVFTDEAGRIHRQAIGSD